MLNGKRKVASTIDPLGAEPGDRLNYTSDDENKSESTKRWGTP